MIDENLARLRAHGQNISRYRRLLHGSLSDLERDYICSRISEEEASLARLIANRGLVHSTTVEHLG
jgi:hypothetical protein